MLGNGVGGQGHEQGKSVQTDAGNLEADGVERLQEQVDEYGVPDRKEKAQQDQVYLLDPQVFSFPKRVQPAPQKENKAAQREQHQDGGIDDPERAGFEMNYVFRKRDAGEYEIAP